MATNGAKKKVGTRTAAASKGSGGTVRWPQNAVAEGEWIQLPNVLLKRMGQMELEPRHLWLLLVLQTARYKNRPPRFYWEELAAFCGKDKNTVRTWARQLKDMGLLKIRPSRELNPGEVPRPGHRNERNVFDLAPFEKRVEEEQEEWVKTRPKPRRRGGVTN